MFTYVGNKCKLKIEVPIEESLGIRRNNYTLWKMDVHLRNYWNFLLISQFH